MVVSMLMVLPLPASADCTHPNSEGICGGTGEDSSVLLQSKVSVQQDIGQADFDQDPITMMENTESEVTGPEACPSGYKYHYDGSRWVFCPKGYSGGLNECCEECPSGYSYQFHGSWTTCPTGYSGVPSKCCEKCPSGHSYQHHIVGTQPGAWTTCPMGYAGSPHECCESCPSGHSFQFHIVNNQPGSWTTCLEQGCAAGSPHKCCECSTAAPTSAPTAAPTTAPTAAPTLPPTEAPSPEACPAACSQYTSTFEKCGRNYDTCGSCQECQMDLGLLAKQKYEKSA